MKRVKYSVYALLLAMSLIASLTVSSGTASAVSDYDENYTTTPTLFYGDVNYYGINCAIQDVSASYYEIFADPNNWVYPGEHGTFWPSFADALENGSWAVSVEQNRMSTGSGYNVQLIWDASGGVLDFYDNHVGTIGSGAKFAQLYMRKELLGSGGCTPAIRAFDGVATISTNPGVDTSTTTNGFFKSNFYAVNWDVKDPVGYEGPPIGTNSPREYVAMGDSFSSGEGNPPFEYGTDISGSAENRCHRSPKAYPRLLQFDPSLDIGSTTFVACSGATTDNVLNGGSAEGAWNEQPQINALSMGTDIVTITIGGNNVGFKSFATACTVGSCDFATTAYSDIHGKITNDLPGELTEAYEAIDVATSSTADIYVVGYPQIAPAEMPTGPNSACYPFNGGADNPDPELNDGATAYAVVSQLNSVIKDAVTAMGSAKFHFVDPNLSGSPFIGHDWCQQDRYFVQIGIPIPPSNTEYSFHPNVDGQEAYKTVIGGEID